LFLVFGLWFVSYVVVVIEPGDHSSMTNNGLRLSGSMSIITVAGGRQLDPSGNLLENGEKKGKACQPKIKIKMLLTVCCTFSNLRGSEP
jgi:hypothetical protein